MSAQPPKVRCAKCALNQATKEAVWRAVFSCPLFGKHRPPQVLRVCARFEPIDAEAAA
jgi:hypothetical protein